MNERNLKVLEQYDVEVRNVRRGRDSYIADTDCGLVILKEYHGSRQRAEWIEKVCRKVSDAGMQADIPIANKDGDYVSTDRDENRYMLKRWIAAREMDVKNTGEICEAVEQLAILHSYLTGFTDGERKEKEEQEKLFEKRIRELRKIFRYVKEKKRKNPFELSFMQYYSEFMKMCEEALELSQKESVKKAGKNALEQGLVCHGDYNQHNILKPSDGMVIVNYENCMVGMQTGDLYCFMRKILEKHNWKLELADKMLQTYMRRHPFTKEELEDLYIKFLFPEKFFKISNHYYNSKKTWIPDRSLSKLDKIIDQSQARKTFLDYLKNTYIS